MQRLFITRHADYAFDASTKNEVLTDIGINVCEQKVVSLQALELGRSALVLSSTTPRAVLTARHIRWGLGIGTGYKSPYLTAAGLRPNPIQNLHDFTSMVLDKLSVTDHGDRDVLVVTHQPLMRVVQKDAAHGIAKVPEGWTNPTFIPAFASLANGDTANLHTWLR